MSVGQSHSYGEGRYTVDIDQHFTDPPEQGEWPITRQPPPRLRAMTLTVTDTATGAYCRFHGQHDITEQHLFEYSGGMPLADIVEKANAVESIMGVAGKRIRKLHPRRYPAFSGDSVCGTCGGSWPCPTLQALGVES